MMSKRIFSADQHFQPTGHGEPIRSVVTQTADAAVIAWCVSPGQSLLAHVHPQGQDTWLVLSGSGMYVMDQEGGAASTRRISAGDIAVAPTGSVHGVTNDGHELLKIIAVVSPADAGFAPV